MAIQILIDGEDIANLPVQYATDFTKKYNAEICEQLGIEVPADYIPLETE